MPIPHVISASAAATKPNNSQTWDSSHVAYVCHNTCTGRAMSKHVWSRRSSRVVEPAFHIHDRLQHPNFPPRFKESPFLGLDGNDTPRYAADARGRSPTLVKGGSQLPQRSSGRSKHELHATMQQLKFPL